MDPVQVSRNRLNALILVLPGQWLSLMAVYWFRFCPPFRPFGFEAEFPPLLLFFAGCALSCAPFLFPPGHFVPRAFERGRLYPALGLRWFRYLATDGTLMNVWLKRIDPTYRVVRDRATLRAYLEGTYQGERWHSAFFIAGFFTTVHAASTHQPVFCLLLTVTNAAFNLYPVFHQRYKRARALRVLRTPLRSEPS